MKYVCFGVNEEVTDWLFVLNVYGTSVVEHLHLDAWKGLRFFLRFDGS